jgi:energy-coupling factor transport system permease protein
VTVSGAAGHGWLAAINPLARLVAVLPAVVLVFLSEESAVSIGCGAAAGLLLAVGGVLTVRHFLLGLVVTIVAVVLLSALFALWSDPDRTITGSWTDGLVVYPGPFGSVTLSAILIASETALRIVAIAILSLSAGVGSTRTGLVDALMQNARLPYRIGYMAYAGIGFLPLMAERRRTIRTAQRVRGGGTGRGPVAFFAREGSAAVALLIDTLRQSERMALVLESRSFGAHPTRTWRREMPWRRRDNAFIAFAFAATTVIIVAALSLG